MSGVFSTLYQGMAVQTASPASGATVVATPDSTDRLLILTPAATLATLTLTAPADATSRLGQLWCFTSNRDITSLTINGGTINNTITSMLANDSKTYQKTGANTWTQVSSNV
jgi:hypothetical protein